MLSKLQALTLRRLSVSQRFALLSFFCVLAITVLVCVASSAVLRRQLVVHDGTVIADLASRLFTSSVPAEFFAVPSGAPPAGAERLREFARSEQVVRFMVYDADGWVLWSDDAAHRCSRAGSRSVATEDRGMLGGEIGAESSFIAASTSTEASSPSYLLFSERKFWAFAERQCLFQRIFAGILGGLRAFSVLAGMASGPRR